jgi:hypothetical protein
LSDHDPVEPASSIPEAGDEAQATAERTRSGPGRLLITVYAIFAIGATSRALVEIATKYHEAPLAYLLSAFAAIVYCVATYCLVRATPTTRRIATVCLTVELVGVLTVGTLSVVRPEDFPQSTVWSYFGIGYLLIPVVLPILGLRWLRRTAPHTQATGA